MVSGGITMAEAAGSGTFVDASRRTFRPRVLLDGRGVRTSNGSETGVEGGNGGGYGIEFERLGVDWKVMQYHPQMMLHPVPGLRLLPLTW